MIEDRFKLVKKSKTFARILRAFQLQNKKVFDIGCGYGEHLVNFGKGSVGITTTQDEIDYGKKNNLRITYSNAEQLDTLKLNENFDVIWANNFFEHILSPHSFLIKLKKFSQKNTTLILGVPVLPKITKLVYLQKFRGALAVAHINFFTRNSLILTVERAGWIVLDARPFKLTIPFLDRTFASFAPHIYIVAKNNPDFQYHEKKRKEWENDKMYSDLLKINS
ncbi:class I SAM-dependent methyltransferase [Patescibacteria group bacterium]|nr:class I SAM-dependent methyltransferase [Patescibacteria group bacterium]